MIKAILAVDADNGIGVGDQLAFANKVDQAFFAGYTMGQTCIVGYNTFQQVKNLKGRNIMLISRDEKHLPDDCIIVGGAKTYKKFASVTAEVLITFFNDSNPNADIKLDPYEVYPHLTKRETVFKTAEFHIEKWTEPKDYFDTSALDAWLEQHKINKL